MKKCCIRLYGQDVCCVEAIICLVTEWYFESKCDGIHVKVYYAAMVREWYVLRVAHCSRIYKEVLCKVAWSKRMLCGSTTNVSLGCVVFVPKNGVVLMRMFVMYSARVVAYVLTVYHCSVIYSPPLCNVLWSNSSWY